ncbi:lectin like domain-containing protein [Butyrivibrio sp. MC2013]|uniref:lectin like domain-containing protein n=1 Tax=Butyrivibrio sp. MC2013 TaxID=1280686 RepID=UPI0004080886|nr:lectin like domain-containing protein [Butyrivibrio sp. MC2013]
MKRFIALLVAGSIFAGITPLSMTETAMAAASSSVSVFEEDSYLSDVEENRENAAYTKEEDTTNTGRADTFSVSNNSIESSTTDDTVDNAVTVVNPSEDIVFPVTGYIEDPSDIEVQSVSDGAAKDLFSVQSVYLPSKYITPNLPPLRDQNPYGTCWAFATTGLAESNLRLTGVINDPDLSELHLSYFVYNQVTDPLGGTTGDSSTTPQPLNIGGNVIWGLNLLDSWTGYASENTAQYSKQASLVQSSGLDTDLAFDDTVHLRNYYEEPIESDTNKITANKHENIKKLVKEFGAASIAFYAYSSMSAVTNGAAYNDATNAYYNPNDNGSNHAVDIVGWDDNFSKKNFATEAPGDGAFLIRNSWETGDGNDPEDNYGYAGYFWMSYYEASLSGPAIAAEFVSSDDYDNNYQYDGGLSTYSTSAIKAANVFTAHAAGASKGEWIRAASFYTGDSNVDYTIDIYTGLTDSSNPESGEHAGTTMGRTSYAGKHTIDLDESVFVASGESFSVVVSLTKDNEPTYIGVETGLTIRSDSGIIRTTVSASEGQSFIYNKSFMSNNASWEDFSAKNSANIRIKAYTDNAGNETDFLPESVSFTNLTSAGKLSIGKGERTKVKTSFLPATTTKKDLIWTSSNESIATVIDGVVEGISEGSARITATSKYNSSVTASFEVTVVKKLLSLGLATNFYSAETGNSYNRIYCYPNPSDYSTDSKAVWTAEDESAVCFQEIPSEPLNTYVTFRKPGEHKVTVTLDGISRTTSFSVFPGEDSYNYKIDENNAVTLNWQAFDNVDSYEVYRENISIYSVDAVAGKSSYSYTDNYYVGKSKTDTVTYYIYYTIDDMKRGVVIRADFEDRTVNYTVTFDYGYDGNILKQTVKNGSKATSPAPARPGYKISGWYTDKELTKQYNFNTPVNSSFTLYAKWKFTDSAIKTSRRSISIFKGESESIAAYSYPSGMGSGISYESQNESIATVDSQGNVTGISAGSCKIKLTKETLTTYVTVTVNVKKPQNLSTASISIKAKNGGKIYYKDGLDANNLEVVAKIGKSVIPSEYLKISELPQKVGTGYAVVEVNEDGNNNGYYGTKKVKITSYADRKINSSSINFGSFVSSIMYSKKYLADNDDFKQQDVTLTYKETGEKLTEGVHYTVSYKGKLNKVGTIKVTYKGLGRYSGKVTKTYKITPYNGELEVTLKGSQTELTYVKGGVNLKNNMIVSEAGHSLKYGTDYKFTVLKKSNLKPGTLSYKLIGLGNYKGISELRTETIAAGDLTKCTVTIKDKKYTRSKSGWKSAPKIKDINGKTLTAGKDYTVSYSYEGMENGTVPAKGYVNVTITGKGCYAGSELTNKSYLIK